MSSKWGCNAQKWRCYARFIGVAIAVAVVLGASEYWDDKAINKAPGQDDLSGFVIEEIIRSYINEFDAAQPLPEEARKTRKEVLRALENLSELWSGGV